LIRRSLAKPKVSKPSSFWLVEFGIITWAFASWREALEFAVHLAEEVSFHLEPCS
jgi:hypothetical protein